MREKSNKEVNICLVNRL